MRRGYRQFCAIARTLDLLGQRWTLLVVRELALRGPLTAAGIARGLPDVPMNQLAERLALLEARGIVTADRRGRGDAARRGRADGNARVYELSGEGRALEDVLGALARFGLDHLATAPEAGEAVLPHVLRRQLELRFDAARAAADGFAGRFELTLTDPEELWSVEPGAPAPGRWALIAGPEGLRARAGVCLDADAGLTLSVDVCTRLVAGDPQAGVEVELKGDVARAIELLDLLCSPARAGVAAAA